MKEYPKALYTGTKQKRKLAIAKNADHEQQLRSHGYVDYAELPDETPSDDVVVSTEECKVLKENWNNGNALLDRLDDLSNRPDLADYSSWTVKQLQAELTRRGIVFEPTAKKAQLIELAKTIPTGTY